MQSKLLLIYLFCTIVTLCNAQESAGFVFKENVLSDKFSIDLKDKLSKYYSAEIPTVEIFNTIKDGDIHEISFSINELYLNFKIWENDLISEKATVRTSEGLRYGRESFGVKTFDLITSDGKRGALTIGPDYISGIIGQYCIQPIHEIIGGLNTRQYAIFSELDVINFVNIICDQHNSSSSGSVISTRSTQCFKGDVDIADDYAFYQLQGNSVTNVQNWNIAKLNTTKTRFDNEFTNPIQYSLDEQFIVTSSITEPWPLNIQITPLLTQFAYWGEGIGPYSTKGFSTSPNQATLWSNRADLTGPFGIAYVGEFCTYYGYNVLKQVSSLSDKLQTHEMGHGMNMAHVSPSNTIYYMNATISSAANQWKTDNATEIQNYLASTPCNNTALYCPSSLPIELYKLEAYPFDCNEIIFKWITLTEINNAYFIIEHAGPDLLFSEIGRVNGQGNINQPSYYEFKDKDPFPGTNYYRLTSVDNNGKSEVHPIRSAKNVCTHNNFVINSLVSENVLFINCNENCDDKNFKIINLNGDVISSGILSPSIQINNLAAGFYIINIEGKVEKFCKK